MSDGNELKNYEVIYTGTFVVVVKGAPDKAKALEWADDERFGGSFVVERTDIREIVDEIDLECSLREANAVSEE